MLRDQTNYKMIYYFTEEDTFKIDLDKKSKLKEFEELISKNALIGYLSYSFSSFFEQIPYKTLHPFHDLEFLICPNNMKFYNISYFELINQVKKIKDNYTFKLERIVPNKSKIDFENDVIKVKSKIEEGEIFQAVISRKYEFSFDGELILPFLNLVEINPSPYIYYLKFGNKRIVGTSPESLFKIKGRKIETYPIAGTRHLGRNEKENFILKNELKKSLKDYAEHSMLVDLARNDLGRICELGTVRVAFYRRIKSFSHVHHIVSKVEGKLKSEVNFSDVFHSIFPAGTVTGAPKIRAMEIIDEIEDNPRGPYAGAVGIIKGKNFADFGITIRSIISSYNKAVIQAGAGIVYDSIPEQEYYETEYKMMALIQAIKSSLVRLENRM